MWYIYVDLFVNSLFDSIYLYVYPFTNTVLSGLLSLYSNPSCGVKGPLIYFLHGCLSYSSACVYLYKFENMLFMSTENLAEVLIKFA